MFNINYQSVTNKDYVNLSDVLQIKTSHILHKGKRYLTKIKQWKVSLE